MAIRIRDSRDIDALEAAFERRSAEDIAAQVEQARAAIAAHLPAEWQVVAMDYDAGEATGVGVTLPSGWRHAVLIQRSAHTTEGFAAAAAKLKAWAAGLSQQQKL